MNPLPFKLNTGTFGELFTQFRLLQFDVQAAAPLKDTGNDLIAVRGEVLRAISVRNLQQLIARDVCDVSAQMFRMRKIFLVGIDSVRIKIDCNGNIEACSRGAETETADPSKKINYFWSTLQCLRRHCGGHFRVMHGRIMQKPKIQKTKIILQTYADALQNFST
jgi:hypothetical protein